MGTLFVVSIPIGNIKDITLRAVETLLRVEYIACEDTRKTGILLKNIRLTQDQKPREKFLISYYEQNELARIPQIINVLKNGFDVALISDAGTPLISDPGFKLVRECIKEGIAVESIPGPSSVIVALTNSGLPTDKFLFLGYPPDKSGHRVSFFHNIKLSQQYINTTVIIFEAPHKLIRTLEELMHEFGNIELVICRELTKVYEEVRREKISDHLDHFKKTTPKGEFVLLFHV